ELLLGRHAEALGRVLVADVAVAGHRREPLASVALVDPGPGRQLLARDRPDPGQRPEEAEPVRDRAERPHVLRGQVSDGFGCELLDLLPVGRWLTHRVSFFLAWGRLFHPPSETASHRLLHRKGPRKIPGRIDALRPAA